MFPVVHRSSWHPYKPNFIFYFLIPFFKKKNNKHTQPLHKTTKMKIKYINKKLIRQKIARTKQNEMKVYKNTTEFIFCWPTIPGQVLALKYGWYIQWDSIGENWFWGGSVSGYQLQTASWLGLGACIHLLPSPILPLVDRALSVLNLHRLCMNSHCLRKWTYTSVLYLENTFNG